MPVMDTNTSWVVPQLLLLPLLLVLSPYFVCGIVKHATNSFSYIEFIENEVDALPSAAHVVDILYPKNNTLHTSIFMRPDLVWNIPVENEVLIRELQNVKKICVSLTREKTPVYEKETIFHCYELSSLMNITDWSAPPCRGIFNA